MGVLNVFFETIAHNSAVIATVLVVIALVYFVLINKKTSEKIRNDLNAIFNIGHNKIIKNPDVAAAMYDEKIDEVNDLILTADSAVRKAGARYNEAKDIYDHSVYERKQLLEKLKRAHANNSDDDAMMFAIQIKEYDGKIQQSKHNREVFKKHFDAANKKKDLLVGEKASLEAEKQLTIDKIKSGLAEKEIMEALQGLNTTELDKSLQSIKEYAEDIYYESVGAEMAYNESATKKMLDAQERADYESAREIMNRLLEEEENETN